MMSVIEQVHRAATLGSMSPCNAMPLMLGTMIPMNRIVRKSYGHFVADLKGDPQLL